jgi:tetratricopeptide (TPR) repeat protein
MPLSQSYRTLKTLAPILTIILMTIMLPPITPLSLARQLDAGTELSRMKSLAGTQHEIVMLLLEENEYEQAMIEANKIFAMNWPEDQEPLLLKELLILSNQFLRHEQARLGLQLIETNEQFFTQHASRAMILKEKGFLYKQLNQNERSIEYFKKARDLEKTVPEPASPTEN